ncbi:MAG: aspartate carbamoyltransferase regulatory subunit [Euryarchaeota archaeon]|nr:aspartate carbamoyltransferase regulatory subunit [Euryarchaeota archaeon]
MNTEVVSQKEMKVSPIRNGTVIDHITPGMALKVLRILGLPREGSRSVVSAIMNVPSESGRRKDIVKIEDRELEPEEVDRISLIAPNATINIIRDYEVAEKHKVALPERAEGTVACSNPNCITNARDEFGRREPVLASFRVIAKEKPVLRCDYCDRDVVNIADQIM